MIRLMQRVNHEQRGIRKLLLKSSEGWAMSVSLFSMVILLRQTCLYFRPKFCCLIPLKKVKWGSVGCVSRSFALSRRCAGVFPGFTFFLSPREFCVWFCLFSNVCLLVHFSIADIFYHFISYKFYHFALLGLLTLKRIDKNLQTQPFSHTYTQTTSPFTYKY